MSVVLCPDNPVPGTSRPLWFWGLWVPVALTACGSIWELFPASCPEASSPAR